MNYIVLLRDYYFQTGKRLLNVLITITESDWMMADEIQKTTPTLDRFSIAMLIEVLEGEDTLNQAENAGRRLSEEELKAIRKHQDEQ